MGGVNRVKLFGIILLFAFGAAFVAWYATVTTEREHYLTRRNFRLLATVATQLDASIDAQKKTLRTLLTASPMSSTAATAEWFEDSVDYVPSLRALDRTRVPSRFDPPKSQAVAKYKSTTAVSVDGPDVWFQISIDRETTTPGPQRASETRQAYLAVGQLLAPMFAPKLRDGAFDTLVLASANGEVLYAEGARSVELAHGRMDTLATPRPMLQVLGDSSAGGKAVGFSSVARTNGVVDVVISGTEYKLFTQPCCSSMRSEARDDPGPVLVGLIETSAFRSKARQIPTTIVFVFSALILLAVAGWPFLRIRLLGESQRIRRIEVVQVIASGLFGIALVTMCCLDCYAYWHLNTVRDVQLQRLAAGIEAHVATELKHARQQLATLTAVAVNCAATSSEGTDFRILRSIFTEAASKELESCGRPADRENWPAKSDALAIAAQPYPQFKTMALIDGTGTQGVKWASRRWQPAPIDVAARPYFRNAKNGRLWRLDDSSPGSATPSCDDSSYTLDSIWSWTTAEPEAVMAIPTCNTAFPVAALTIPMTSLINPVVSAGVEFAVIAEDGTVLFHSDPQRNTYEDLFEETDQNRRLRAAVAAHVAEYIDLRYAGRSYRSYVQRLGAGTPWAIVTLSSNEPTWGLHSEWLVLSLVALVTFFLGLAVLFGLCFFTGRSDWLWADFRQVHRYRALTLMTALLLCVSLLVLVLGANRTVMTLSIVLPLTGWGISYLVVRRPPLGQMPVRDAHPEWRSLAVLLFLLTGMVPATGFLTAVYRLDVRADVKHVQLQFARALAEHEQQRKETTSEYPNVPTPGQKLENRDDVYYTPDPATLRPGYLPSAHFVTERDPPAQDPPPNVIDGIAEIVAEEYLPYYSERAVQIRELLLHQRAEDNAWWWSNDGLTYTPPGGQQAIVVTAAVPRLADGLLEAASFVPGGLVVLGAMGLFALAWFVVWFIEVHVCLRGVEEPLWAKARWTGSSGQNLFVICDLGERDRLAKGCFDLQLESQGWSLTDDAIIATLTEHDRSAPGCAVLFRDLDRHLANSKLAQRQLAWLEWLAADDTRTVVVLSSDLPSGVDQTLSVQSRTDPADPRLLERWRTLLGSFTVIDWRTEVQDGRNAADTSWFSHFLKEPLPRTVEGIRGLLDVRNDRVAIAALMAEARADAFVRAVCESIKSRLPDRTRVPEISKPDPEVAAESVPATSTSELRTDRPTVAASSAAKTKNSTPAPSTIVRLSSEQVLDEITDRTRAWYRRIWRSCSPDERLVLAEIASEGFVNYKSRRWVRRLLGRRLIAKDPSFRLMNETFRRFVLSSSCQADILTIQGASEPSPWDRLRVPFFTVVVSTSLFFLVTQRELFNATIATLSTLAAAVPVMTRVVTLVAGKRVDSEQKV